MAGHWSVDSSFLSCAFFERDIAAVVMKDDDSINNDMPFSYITIYYKGEWDDGGGTQWDTIGAATTMFPSRQFVIISPQGNALLLGGGDRHEEQIQDGEINPQQFGMLREVRRIGQKAFACGMKRQVYRRDNRDVWTCLTKDIMNDKGVYGFESIDGFSESDIYAVGWEGEIWHFNGSQWSKKDSPTNNILVDVCCAGDGKVYAYARGGKLIIGRDDQWDVVNLEVPADLWSLAWFQGKLYASSSRDIFVFDGTAMVPIKIEGDFPRSCQYLSVHNDEVMWSIGSKDIFSFDGATWTRID